MELAPGVRAMAAMVKTLPVAYGCRGIVIIRHSNIFGTLCLGQYQSVPSEAMAIQKKKNMAIHPTFSLADVEFF